MFTVEGVARAWGRAQDRGHGLGFSLVLWVLDVSGGVLGGDFVDRGGGPLRVAAVTDAEILLKASDCRALEPDALAAVIRAIKIVRAEEAEAARLAVDAEREACAAAVDAFADGGEDFVSVERVVEAIRARGSK